MLTNVQFDILGRSHCPATGSALSPTERAASAHSAHHCLPQVVHITIEVPIPMNPPPPLLPQFAHFAMLASK